MLKGNKFQSLDAELVELSLKLVAETIIICGPCGPREYATDVLMGQAI